MIEDRLGLKLPHGIVVLGDVTRERVVNTAELRTEVLVLGDRISAARARFAEPIPVRPVGGQRQAGRDGRI